MLRGRAARTKPGPYGQVLVRGVDSGKAAKQPGGDRAAQSLP
jgi:hypothetical protein